jgi:hypothetical protein
MENKALKGNNFIAFGILLMLLFVVMSILIYRAIEADIFLSKSKAVDFNVQR